MTGEWTYRVVVSTDENPVAYEGHFKRFCYARKMADRKLREYEGTGAFVSIYERYEGTHMMWVA